MLRIGLTGGIACGKSTVAQMLVKRGEMAFKRGRLNELNAIVHPAVIAAQTRWMAEVERDDPNGIAIVEAALLIEAGADKDFDKTIVVTCDLEHKVEHYAHRTGLSLEAARGEVERRSAAQFSDEVKARHADYVIENSGPIEDTERQVEEIWHELQPMIGR